MNQKQAVTEAGTLDPSFGLDGVVGWPINGPTGNYPESLLELADGKLLVAEIPSHAGSAVLRRLNTDGTLDEAFGNDGSVEIKFEIGDRFSIPVLNSHPDGGWVLTGQLVRLIDGGFYGFEVVVRQFEDGLTDPDFGDKGILYVDTQKLVDPDAQVPAAVLAKRFQDPAPPEQQTANAGSAARSCAVSPDGKIVLIDEVFDSDQALRGIVVRLNPNGSLDTSFNGKGFTLIELDRNKHEYGGVQALVVQGDGKVLVTGKYKILEAPETQGIYVTRYLKDGQLDSQFGTQGIATISLTSGVGLSWVGAIALRKNDGAITVAGYLSREGKRRGWAAVLNESGAVNLVFNDGKTLYSDMLPEGVNWKHCEWPTPDALLVSGSGGGAFVNENSSILIARYQANGALDKLFNKEGWATYKNGSPTMSDCVVLKDQRIIVCGRASRPVDYKGYVLCYHG